MKDTNRKLEVFEGHNLDKKTRDELIQAHKQMTEAMNTIGKMLANNE